MVWVDVSAQHDDRDGFGTCVLQCVRHRLSTRARGPRVVDDQGADRLGPRRHFHPEPVRLELTLTSAVREVGDSGYPWQADPLSAESVEGVPANATLGTRNRDHMSGLSTHPGSETGMVIT